MCAYFPMQCFSDIHKRAYIKYFCGKPWVSNKIIELFNTSAESLQVLVAGSVNLIKASIYSPISLWCIWTYERSRQIKRKSINSSAADVTGSCHDGHMAVKWCIQPFKKEFSLQKMKNHRLCQFILTQSIILIWPTWALNSHILKHVIPQFSHKQNTALILLVQRMSAEICFVFVKCLVLSRLQRLNRTNIKMAPTT